MLTWILLASLLTIPAQAGDANFEEVASITELMTAMIIPSSNVVGNVGLDGDPSDEQWAEIERQSIVLAESGNLLLMPSRAQGREDWIAAATAMRDAGVLALEAARAKNADALMIDISGAVFDACTQCHDQYFN
ncbi:MAG TPA: hypothetical protein VGA18_02425 [Rhodothermales bacterium]|jgi:hypothetical protein